MIALVLLGAALAQGGAADVPSSTPSPPARTLGVPECVSIALAGSGLVGQARGRIAEWEARLAEVESIHYPKLTAIGWVAPMYRVEAEGRVPTYGGSEIRRDLGAWGPYFHAQALLVQPLYTFGRAAAAAKAAGARVDVERARVLEVKTAVALEVRRFYYLHLYARSVVPSLESARKILDEAQKRAREQFDAGTGQVTSVDLARLEYGSAELDRHRLQAGLGAELSLAALKHVMGLPMTEDLELADERLPGPPDLPLPPLPELILLAARERPEVEQLRAGREAALSLEQAERLASMPTLFAAGQIDLNHSPMRESSGNPYLEDPYNRVTGGIAVGLQIELDLARSSAKEAAARAMQEQVEGLAILAATGIPLEVRRAHDQVVLAGELHELAERGSSAGRRWMTFASSAYHAGTGEPKEILEGLAAYVSARRNLYESLLAIHVGRAELLRAIGAAETVPTVAP